MGIQISSRPRFARKHQMHKRMADKRKSVIVADIQNSLEYISDQLIIDYIEDLEK